jgi:hypothetical protein
MRRETQERRVGGQSCNGNMQRVETTAKALLRVMDVYTRSHLSWIARYTHNAVTVEFSVKYSRNL